MATLRLYNYWSRLLSIPTIAINLADNRNATPLFWAVLEGSSSRIELMLEKPLIDAACVDRDSRNTLSWAAEESPEDIVKRLVSSGRFNIGQRDRKGSSALSYAVERGHLEIIRSIVKSKGVEISACDTFGRNAVSLASSRPNREVLRYLIRHDTSAALISDINGWTPLHWAFDPSGYPNNVMVLLKKALVDVKFRDLNQRSALLWATRYGYVEIVQTLVLLADADVEARDKNGRTPLSYAERIGSPADRNRPPSSLPGGFDVPPHSNTRGPVNQAPIPQPTRNHGGRPDRNSSAYETGQIRGIAGSSIDKGLRLTQKINPLGKRAELVTISSRYAQR